MALTKRTYTDGETIITAQNLNDIQEEIISLGNTSVPNTRKVNGKALSGNITLNAGDIGFSGSASYDSSSVGKAVQDASGAISNIDLANVQNVTTASTNLDDYTSGGVFYFQSAYTPSNKPTDAGTFGFLIVIKGGSNARLVQYWIDTTKSQNRMWMRSNSTSTVSWGNWKKISTADLTAEEITVEVENPLPTGVTAVGGITVVQSGNVVTVSLGITRDTTSLTNYTTIATGLPIPKVRPMSGNNTIPFGQIMIASSTPTRPLNVSVSSSGNLIVARGEVSSGTAQFLGSFTYITDKI